MASIRTSIELYDAISAPLTNITNALNMTVSAFEQMDAAANESFDSSNFDGVRDHINAATMELNEMVQDINEADQQQQRFNESMNQGTRSASGLERKLLGVAATYASLQGAQKLLNLSDTATLTESRLSLIVDDGGSVEELQNKIFASAQKSRAAYSDVSATIAKLGMMAGDAFTNNDELIAFTELMNKNFVVGGASATEQASAMYQLTQAMASGRLQGDEYRSIIENAPLLAKSIEDYMTNVQGATGSMKDWASEGMLTADVIKAAMFNASEQVNEQFENMPKTFGQVATSLKNQALFAFDPVLERLNEIANSQSFNTMVTGATNAFVFLSGVAVGALDMITQAGAFISDNWSIIAPLVYGVAAALALYTGYMIISNAVQLISTGIQTAHAIAIAVKTGATIADAAATNGLTVAQWALNSAMLASPITWIIIGIIAIIAIIYMAVAAFNTFAGTSVSATGIIMGAFAWLGTGILNILIFVLNLGISVAEGLVNIFISAIFVIQLAWIGLNVLIRFVLDSIINGALTVAEGIGNGWNSMIYGLQMGFYYFQVFVSKILQSIGNGAIGVANGVLSAISSIINGAASGINSLINLVNKIPGVNIGTIGEIDLRVGSGIQNFVDNIGSNISMPTRPEQISFERSNLTGSYMDDLSMPKAPEMVEFGRIDYKDMGAAWDTGYSFGEGIKDKVSNFSMSDLFESNIPNSSDYANAMVDPSDYASGLGGAGSLPSDYASGLGGAGSVPSDISDIADNTGKIKDSVDISQEDLKYLRDIAEAEVVNRFTTAEIKVDMSGMQNIVNNEMDLDGVVSYLGEGVNEAMEKAAEGVHN